MMRFLLSYRAVKEMRRGASPTEAAEISLRTIRNVCAYTLHRESFYVIFFHSFQDTPFTAAVLCMTPKGDFGGASIGTDNFAITVRSLDSPNTIVVPIKPLALK